MVIQEEGLTVCELINDIKSSNVFFDTSEGQEFLDGKLDLIRYKANKMEKRLLEYCNAIESLGFNKIGRDYIKQ